MIDNLLNATKKKLGIESDYALAKKLETSTARLGQWRKRKSTPDEEACFRIAEILEVEEAAIIAAVREEAAKDPAKREFWGARARKYTLALGMVAAMSPNAVSASTGGFLGGHQGGWVDIAPRSCTPNALDSGERSRMIGAATALMSSNH